MLRLEKHGIYRPHLLAPLLHTLLFALTSVLMWISTQPLLDGPARWPFGLLWFADLPISGFAFGVMFMSDEHFWTAWGSWGAVGTGWWYLLGLSIEAWMRRLRKRRNSPQP